MAVRLGFENDDRYYAVPSAILAMYPLSPIHAFSIDSSCDKPNVYVIENISYDDFKSGHDYIMSCRRAVATKKAKKILIHYGFWNDELEIYERNCKRKIDFYHRVVTGVERMVIVDTKELYNELSAFTAKPHYSYVVPVEIHMVDGSFSHLGMSLDESLLDECDVNPTAVGKSDMSVPIYPPGKFMESDFFKSADLRFVDKFFSGVASSDQMTEQLRRFLCVTTIISGWMIRRLKIDASDMTAASCEIIRILQCFISDMKSNPEIITLAIEGSTPREIYYGFYLAPNP
ncbi:Hypothetical protein POVR1_LOCUS167 [uncultured virus]|nr:Hypothetical protein POVR1_LOCUS167 [uncultured virus]